MKNIFSENYSTDQANVKHSNGQKLSELFSTANEYVQKISNECQTKESEKAVAHQQPVKIAFVAALLKLVIKSPSIKIAMVAREKCNADN